ncbi:NTP pyrophosphohydrolase [Microbacterium sp. 18062]|uniref:NTP pyrophosphohydrolase n=1 Tax=Microbacterium sp. 18062 TaxID=2681410 RepID=UPI001F1F17F5|nr:NTP pyrophosphohydrolase [Microbacterium sp. 18062]
MTVESPVRRVPDAAPEVRGGVRVRQRVIEKVVREASAVTIGVPRDDVHVEVAEWGGGLAVRVAARLPIPDLDDTEAIRAETPLLDRVRQAQSMLAGEFARLTGREIRRVSFTVTGALIPERRRVR